MFRTAFVAAFVAAASAASWPMITVNSAGDIVLNSPTRAASFQLTAASVTAAPTSGTTASRTTVTDLGSDTDSFIVSVPSSPATSAGFKLPTPTVGRTITLYNDGTGAGAYTVWTASTSEFFDSSTSINTVDVASTTTWISFTATDTTNWVISSSAAATGASSIGFTTINDVTSITASSTATTLSATNTVNAQYTVKANTGGAVALTLPSVSDIESLLGASAQVGSTFTFRVNNRAVAVAGTDVSITITTSSGITSYGSLEVPAEAARTFYFVRTAASTYDMYAGKTEVGAVTTVTATVTTGSATAQTGTCHGLVCSFTAGTAGSASGGDGTLETAAAQQVWTITNNYRKVGDAVTLEQTGSGNAANDVKCWLGQGPTTSVAVAANTIYAVCSATTGTASAPTFTLSLTPA